MTKHGRCRDFERLMLDGEDRALTAEERDRIEEHTRTCGSCRSFSSDRALMRGGLAGAGWPAPSEDLVGRTRRRMRQEESDAATERPGVPAWILAAVAVATIVTGLWAAVSLADVTAEMTLADLPAAALAAVGVIVQNAVMLIFVPVVLRAFRAKRAAAAKA